MSLFHGIRGGCYSGGQVYGSGWICREQVLAAEHANITTIGGMRGLPTGVFWERTGGKSHRVVIRREVEFVP